MLLLDCLSVCPSVGLSVCKLFASPLCSVPDDLSPEERQELECIRRRKEELLLDIQVTGHRFFHYTRVGSGVSQQKNTQQNIHTLYACACARVCVCTHVIDTCGGRHLTSRPSLYTLAVDDGLCSRLGAAPGCVSLMPLPHCSRPATSLIVN